MTLTPAIFSSGKVYTGDTHPAIRKTHALDNGQEGFTDPDGKFMSRAHSKLWLRSKQPEVYANWLTINGDGEEGELHIDDLRDAMADVDKVNYKTSSWHIHDMGLFTELAVSLAPHVGRITYTSPWKNAFPSSKDTEIMEGMAPVERVDDIHDIIDETDLFIFPDIYYSELQIDLRNKGKRVFGSRDGDKIEIYRSEAKPYFDSIGIAQGPYVVVKGIKKLRQYVKDNGKKKLWIKIDKTRGDMETFCVEPGHNVSSYDLYKNRIDDLEYHLGPKADILDFVIEESLEGTIDIAIDTQGIDGQWPAIALLGTEEKGECYICSRKKWVDMPPRLIDIYDKLSPILKQCEYRNFISLESRASEKEICLGDPCCRGGSPPFELQLNMIDNIPDIMWFGGEGKVMRPRIPSKYGVELIVHSDWADKHPLMVDFPKKYRNQVKFRYNSMFDGNIWIMPQGAGPRIAAVVAHGNSLDDCMEEAKEISGQLKGIQIEAFSRSFPIAKEKIAKLKEWGINL